MINHRIQELREEMKKEGISIYFIPTQDYHLSEMVGDYFQARRYMSGFTGSNGDLIVTLDEALLWTDGRYFLQAENQLQGSFIKLKKMGQEGVETVSEYIETHIKEGEALGFDGKVVSANLGIRFNEIVNRHKASIKCDIDLVGRIWKNRPKMSTEKAFELGVKYAGVDRLTKIKNLEGTLTEKGYDATVITSLDDIMWLYNIRGNDVECTPVTLSYTIVGKNGAVLYINDNCLSNELKDTLAKDGVIIRDYFDIYEDIKTLEGKVYFDLNNLNYALYNSFSTKAILYKGMNFTTLPKACKNPVEQENVKLAHIKDGVALVKFIYWLKKNVGKIDMTELSVSSKLEEFRRLSNTFVEPSFTTICGYNAHGAIVHYSATEETDAKIDAQGLLLVDSGGQYLEGTTDVTRTIVLGKVSDQCKRDFTNVLKGYLALSKAVFKEGTRGSSLDVLARKALWENAQDFNHGTGHGVGYFLNVHEGPQSIHFGRVTAYPFQEGMLTSDEPGMYITNEYGIRHESLLLCKKYVKNEYGQFYNFEVVTLAPFDLEGINVDMLTDEEKKTLNEYHKNVYNVLKDYLNDEEKHFLKEATKEI